LITAATSAGRSAPTRQRAGAGRAEGARASGRWAVSAWSFSGGLFLTFVTPTMAWAIGAEGHARMGPVLFALAVLVVAAKVGGLLAERWGQPSVLGELLVGIGLGNLLPPLFGERGIAFVRSDPTLLVLAEVGVLIRSGRRRAGTVWARDWRDCPQGRAVPRDHGRPWALPLGPDRPAGGRTGQPGILLVFGLALCFVLAFAAELVGLAGIVGAFAAGLLLDQYGEGVRARAEEATLSELLHPLSGLFVPLFFVLMGIQVHLGGLADRTVLGFGVVLVLRALAGKLACGLGVVRRGMNPLAVAFGMVPRGEVGLIFAGIGTSLTLQGAPLLSQGVFSAVVLMVLVTTLVAPVGLRWTFGDRSHGH